LFCFALFVAKEKYRPPKCHKI